MNHFTEMATNERYHKRNDGQLTNETRNRNPNKMNREEALLDETERMLAQCRMQKKQNKSRNHGSPSSKVHGNSPQKNGTPHQYAKRKFKGFAAHWKSEDVNDGLKRGHLLQANIRVNPKNYEESYCPHPDGVSDIFIPSFLERNRALNGDVVAVQLYDKTMSRVMIEDLEETHPDLMAELAEVRKKFGVQFPAPGDPDHAKIVRLRDLLYQRSEVLPGERDKILSRLPTSLASQISAPPSADKVDQRSALLDLVPDRYLQRCGQVVAILEQKHSRACTGILHPMTKDDAKHALLHAVDHRVPRIMLPLEDCPKDFLARPQDHAKTLFVARITEWRRESLFADGRLARSLGEAGEIEPETEGILMENGIESDEFSEEVLACLPQDLPWKIPEKEFQYRRDLRHECIFTIDPATARDLDDAVHCTQLANGLYEVGVHIADVSFFVNDDTMLDKKARKRSTSVYLTQKVIPMLPRLLCEELCSLNPDVDRLCFSVVWRMDEEGKVYDEWFGRSIIRSCCKLAYEHAQGFIEAPERDDWSRDELPTISDGVTIDMIRTRVLQLDKIAKNLRAKRFDSGALRLDQVKLRFTLNGDTGMPNGYSVYEQKDSNRLIEEYMLYANMAVARKIYQTFPEISVLRRHPAPQTRMLEMLEKLCKSYGFQIDCSSAGALQRSLWSYAEEGATTVDMMQILVNMVSKPMQFARYFCTGTLDDEELFRHYALNVPLYTHFTSPIRRYPDVMVHRLLAASLGYRDAPEVEKKLIQYVCDHCNDQKLNAKNASEASSQLYFSIFVKEVGPLYERGMVMAVLDRSFDVLITKLGVVKRVYCEQLQLDSFKFQKNQGKPEILLTWPVSDAHPAKVTQRIALFTAVSCVLKADEEPRKWTALIQHPDSVEQNL